MVGRLGRIDDPVRICRCTPDGYIGKYGVRVPGGETRGDIAVEAADLSGGERKLFLERKKQKSFMSLAACCGTTNAKSAKVFWFFFSKKNMLASRFPPRGIQPPPTLNRHAAVGMAAAIGVPDKLRTESIRAYIVLAAGHTPSDALAEELKVSVRDRLAKHEQPRDIVFVPELPLTTTGKVLRRELRDRARAEHARGERGKHFLIEKSPALKSRGCHGVPLG